jgi:hypothetical protein
MRKFILFAVCMAVVVVLSAPAIAARSGAGSGSAGGTAFGGNTGGQNPTFNKDAGHGDYQQRARFLGNGPP